MSSAAPRLLSGSRTLVAEATGASRVLVFDHTIRRRVAGGIDRSPGTPRQPVTSVHNDYTVKSGPQRVRDLMGEEVAQIGKKRAAPASDIMESRRTIRSRPNASPPSERRQQPYIRIQRATPRLPPTRTPLLLTVSPAASISMRMHQ